MMKSNYAPKCTNKVQDTDLFGVTLYDFVKKHTTKIAGKFYSILSDEDMEDLVHDIYLKVYGKRHQYKEGGNFNGWVWRICRNAVYDYADAKKEYYEEYLAIDEGFDDDDAMDIDHTSVLADWAFATDRQMILEELKNNFWKAINKLSPDSREVVELLMNDTPYDVMAEILGCSDGAVRVKVYRARKELERYNIAA
jgi:RNA polymerase sigma-70 factor (ECF subfamily)